MVEAFRGLDGGLPGRPPRHVRLQFPDGAQRRVDQGLGPVANARVGVDAFPAAGEGRAGVVVSGSGGCGRGAEDGEGERDGEQGGADTGHGVPSVSFLEGLSYRLTRSLEVVTRS